MRCPELDGHVIIESDALVKLAECGGRCRFYLVGSFVAASGL